MRRCSMGAGVSNQTKREVLEALRGRYGDASKSEKSSRLDEFIAVAHCHRKQLTHPFSACPMGAERLKMRGIRLATRSLAVRHANSDGFGPD